MLSQVLSFATDEDSTTSLGNHLCLTTLIVKKCLLPFNFSFFFVCVLCFLFCFLLCAQCFLFCQWALLRIWLPLLHSFPSGTYTFPPKPSSHQIVQFHLSLPLPFKWKTERNERWHLNISCTRSGCCLFLFVLRDWLKSLFLSTTIEWESQMKL